MTTNVHRLQLMAAAGSAVAAARAARSTQSAEQEADPKLLDAKKHLQEMYNVPPSAIDKIIESASQDALSRSNLHRHKVNAIMDAIATKRLELLLCSEQLRQAQNRLADMESQSQRSQTSAFGRIAEHVKSLSKAHSEASEALFHLEEFYPRERTLGLERLAPDLIETRQQYRNIYGAVLFGSGAELQALHTQLRALTKGKPKEPPQQLGEETRAALAAKYEADAANLPQDAFPDVRSSIFLEGLLRESQALIPTFHGHVLEVVEKARAKVSAAVEGPAETEAGEPLIDVKMPSATKDPARCWAKAMEKYNGDVSQIKDIVRATIFVRPLGTRVGVCALISAVVSALEESGSEGKLDVVRAKNRWEMHFDAADAGGYRDILLNVLVGPTKRLVAEIQLNSEAFLKVKDTKGHKAYGTARVLHGFDIFSTSHSGDLSYDALRRVESGLLTRFIAPGSVVNPVYASAVLTDLNLALSSPTCRLEALDLGKLTSTVGNNAPLRVPWGVLLTPGVGKLLTVLSLDYCKFELGEAGFPWEALLQMKNLTKVRLQGNSISGPLPQQIGHPEDGLRFLRVLRLNTNNLSGELPQSLTQLTDLRHLNVYGNQLQGLVPAGLADLPRLNYLAVSGQRGDGNGVYFGAGGERIEHTYASEEERKSTKVSVETWMPMEEFQGKVRAITGEQNV